MVETVLVSGSGGYVASHVVRAFLEAGYNVKGTVRHDSDANSVRATHPGFEDRLSFAVVPDIAVPGAFDEAAKGVAGIIHTASPFTFAVKDVEKELLIPARQGTLNTLEAAALTPSVRRVVLTESFASIMDPSKGLRPGYVYTEQDWNPATWESASKSGPIEAYLASKTLAERAAWQWIDDKKPNFTLVSICPPWIFGPAVNGRFNINKLGESIAMVWSLVSGSIKEVPPTDFAGFADVRDIAQAHLKAFEVKEAGGNRFLVANHFDYQTAIDKLRAEVPSLQEVLLEGTPGAGLKEPVYEFDTSRVKDILGLEFTPLEKTLRDTARDLLESAKSQ